jgi:hypothetical protein
MTDLSSVQTVTEIINKDNILAKNNQKKEKAERNKINADKYKKRPRSNRFGNRQPNTSQASA